jgi:hypothetical protein
MTATGVNLFGWVRIDASSISALTWRTADSLCRKWNSAKEGIAETQPAFEQLSESIDRVLIEVWTEQERVAMAKRGEHLKIYEVKSEKCKTFILRRYSTYSCLL